MSENIMTPWKHDDLLADLTTHLRGSTDRMVWCDTQLGPSGSPRPDVFAITKSYSQFKADAYEIKISVSDLRSDTTSGKWQKYLKYAHRVWFAIPAGLVRLDEIPRQCGVIVRHDKVWRAARKPISQAMSTLPHDAWMKLLIESFPDASAHPAPRPANEWLLMQSARAKFGDAVGKLLADRQGARMRFEEETRQIEINTKRLQEKYQRDKERSKEMAEQLERSLVIAEKTLAKTLGLDQDASPSQLVEAIHGLNTALSTYSLDSLVKNLQGLQAVLRATKEAKPKADIELTEGAA